MRLRQHHTIRYESMIYEKPTVAELSDYIIYAQEMNIQPKERPYVVFKVLYLVYILPFVRNVEFP